MSDVKLKVCGLKDPDVAAQAVRLGVDYIGLIFHPASKRHVDIDLAKLIAKAVHEKNGRIVPVFVEQTAAEISDIAAQLSADFIQLHGVAAVKSYLQICDQYDCIVAENLCDDVSMLNPQRDFLLYDYHNPGSGTTFDWKQIVLNKRFRSFVAGGINITNAKQAIEHFHPFALDVSSGVEDDSGEKDIGLIRELVGLLSGIPARRGL
jgi:phosphoribosylanthranilate isomerase